MSGLCKMDCMPACLSVCLPTVHSRLPCPWPALPCPSFPLGFLSHQHRVATAPTPIKPLSSIQCESCHKIEAVLAFAKTRNNLFLVTRDKTCCDLRERERERERETSFGDNMAMGCIRVHVGKRTTRESEVHSRLHVATAPFLQRPSTLPLQSSQVLLFPVRDEK